MSQFDYLLLQASGKFLIFLSDRIILKFFHKLYTKLSQKTYRFTVCLSMLIFPSYYVFFTNSKTKKAEIIFNIK